MTKAEELFNILESNRSIKIILDRVQDMNLPDWYLGAGGIAQTVWNVKHGFHPEYGIKDYDLVYYDANDVSDESEKSIMKKGRDVFCDVPVPTEFINQARVHLWYEKDFGKSLNQYKSTEDAISTWPTTATSIGVTRDEGGGHRVFAPFGLDDLLGQIVRTNKVLITQQIYQNKVDRWTMIWPDLQVIPWNEKIVRVF